jgi:predicted transcriptional regulator
VGKKNELRDAELCVIDEAVLFTAAWRPDIEQHDFRRLYNNLCLAVDRYMNLSLQEAATAAVSRRHPETSHHAAASLTNVGAIARKVFDEIALVFEESGTGLTSDQVEQILGGRHQTISARVNELRERGWITDSGLRRPTRSGRKAIVWKPTQKAMIQR